MVAHMKTTIEIADELLDRAKETARKEKTTLRSLVEEGLRKAVAQRRRPAGFTLRDASVDGQGLAPEYRGASWQKIRDAVYEGRGA